jgi:hypothetical protein
MGKCYRVAASANVSNVMSKDENVVGKRTTFSNKQRDKEDTKVS